MREAAGRKQLIFRLTTATNCGLMMIILFPNVIQLSHNEIEIMISNNLIGPFVPASFSYKGNWSCV